MCLLEMSLGWVIIDDLSANIDGCSALHAEHEESSQILLTMSVASACVVTKLHRPNGRSSQPRNCATTA